MKEADEAYKTAEEKFIKADEEIRGNYDRDYNHLLEINEPIGRNPSDAEKKDLRTKYGEENVHEHFILCKSRTPAAGCRYSSDPV